MNLYIHVPFCIKKCNYCAFHSIECSVPDWDKYTASVLRQLDQFHSHDFVFDTIFFGGGTPSLLPPKYAEKIIKYLRIATGAEFTIEANPKTIKPNELKDWRDLGLNRLSIGIQSLNDDDLKFLGRIHSVKDSMELIDAANDLGMRISGDFIYGLPGQKVGDIADICHRINDLNLPHVSMYELTIERGTPFSNMSPIDNEIAADMYMAIQSELKLPRYEISNYGDPCQHNSSIWAGQPYIGVGESAAGRVIQDGTWWETKITDGDVIMAPLSSRDRAVEIIITGLRTTNGITPNEYIDMDFIRANPEWFHITGGRISMTDAGILLLDGLLTKIIK